MHLTTYALLFPQLLNHILTDKMHGQKFAVIENEVGAVAIDNQIIKKNLDEEIIEVTNGCICCSIRGDLVRALDNLYAKVDLHGIDGILLETTGLADPAPIIQTFFQNEDIQKKFRLDGVVTVIDAKHILERLAETKSDGAVNEAAEQIAFADKILLNKTDLVTDPSVLVKIEEEIQSINTTAPILRTVQSKVDDPRKELLNIGGFDLDRALQMDANFLTVERRHRKDQAVGSIAMEIEGSLNINQLQRWLGKLVGGADGADDADDGDDHGHDHSKHDHDSDKENVLYRYKGILSVQGVDKKFIFQGVGMSFQGNFSDELWGPDEVKKSQFVFIGRNLDKTYLDEGFRDCLAKPLRFPVGTFVECFTGEPPTGWKEGTVIQHWDDGNPYRIELYDSSKRNIWAPVDIDECIRMSCSAV